MERIVYCRCAFAEVVKKEIKDEVLRGLCSAGVSFSTVPDLCEMAARKDPAMTGLLREGPLRVAACHPRAVKWLFHAAGAEGCESEEALQVVNMRDLSAAEALQQLLPGEENGK